MTAERRLICAIYTRKSTEEGLDQNFNSLDAQRDACENFIASQKSEGWVMARERYDDGGFSGGNMQRPGLQKLLDDVRNGMVDIIVVYKIDRLSRSLARAVIFAQMVDDPSSWPDLFPTEKKQDKERQRLFKIIEDLVQWENTTNEEVLQRARDAIWESWRRACAENADHPQAKEIFNRTVLPGFHDPFAGGGALPLEAQRLGLESHASDLNPVAVLINKAMIEIPPRFANKSPVNPEVIKKADLVGRNWFGAEGLAEDVLFYGQWMRNRAEDRIGNLYPKIEVTKEMAKDRPDLFSFIGQKLTVIAWLWARTVKSPNPAFAGIEVPLASTFMLSTKAGKEAYVEPIINQNEYKFKVRTGKPSNAEELSRGTKSVGSGSSFLCLLSGTPIPFDYIREQAKSGLVGSKLMAIVADGPKGKIYLDPNFEMEKSAYVSTPIEISDSSLPEKALGFRIQEYGMNKWKDLFNQRQLLALTTLSDLLADVHEKIIDDCTHTNESNKKDLREIHDYADAIILYLAFAIDRCADYWTTLGRWQGANQQLSNMFGRHAIPMVWDFPEANPFSKKGGSFDNLFEWTIQSIQHLGFGSFGKSYQADASTQDLSINKVVSTDPPYYDNIGYADLSDFFYFWLRRSLRNRYTDLFTTVGVPKAEELVATPFRHGSRQKAETFFLEGMRDAMHRISEQAHPAFPITIYYAFKQSETETDAGTASTGWETFLDAVIQAGFVLTGTWPFRSEMKQRMIGLGTNALASNIILVCRPRPFNAPTATRREFLNALKAELPLALSHLQDGNVAPSDLAQSAIGPGMAVYTRYSKVIDAEGNQLSVRSALALINQTIDEIFTDPEGDFDSETRWALSWFEQTGFEEGEFGVADVLARAKGTAVNSLGEAGIVRSGRGKVRLLRPSELEDKWPSADSKKHIVWGTLHHLIRIQTEFGEEGAAKAVSTLGIDAETARSLCYRLYTVCERKKRAADAMPYNALVQSWPEIIRLAQQSRQSTATAGDLFNQE